MTPEGAALARHRMSRAREALRDADLLAAQQSAAGAVNRYYYAAFHAARALLATIDLDAARHSGVIALFQRHFVKTGLFSTDIARVLPRSFEKRLNSDYGDFAQVTAEEVDQISQGVHRFVEECQRVLGSPQT